MLPPCCLVGVGTAPPDTAVLYDRLERLRAPLPARVYGHSTCWAGTGPVIRHVGKNSRPKRSNASMNFLLNKFKSKVLLVLLFECETLLPIMAFFPVI